MKPARQLLLTSRIASKSKRRSFKTCWIVPGLAPRNAKSMDRVHALDRPGPDGPPWMNTLDGRIESMVWMIFYQSERDFAGGPIRAFFLAKEPPDEVRTAEDRRHADRDARPAPFGARAGPDR